MRISGIIIILLLSLRHAKGQDDGGSWTEWGEWSACSRTCDEGVRQQTRRCVDASGNDVDGSECSGSPVRTETCEVISCPDVARPNCNSGYSFLELVYDEVEKALPDGVKVKTDRDIRRPNENMFAKTRNVYKAFLGSGTSLEMNGKDSIVITHRTPGKLVQAVRICNEVAYVKRTTAFFYNKINKKIPKNPEYKSDLVYHSVGDSAVRLEGCTDDFDLRSINDPVDLIHITFKDPLRKFYMVEKTRLWLCIQD